MRFHNVRVDNDFVVDSVSLGRFGAKNACCSATFILEQTWRARTHKHASLSNHLNRPNLEDILNNKTNLFANTHRFVRTHLHLAVIRHASHTTVRRQTSASRSHHSRASARPATPPLLRASRPKCEPHARCHTRSSNRLHRYHRHPLECALHTLGLMALQGTQLSAALSAELRISHAHVTNNPRC